LQEKKSAFKYEWQIEEKKVIQFSIGCKRDAVYFTAPMECIANKYAFNSKIS
jgi:hypothetical protein